MRKLGILGGMGPAATVEFLRLLTECTLALRDQDHIRYILLEDPKIPDRTAALFLDGEEPSPILERDIKLLQSWGADLVAIPCNTAHVFLDRIKLPIPIVHIVYATILEAKARFSQGALLLSTSGTRTSGIYECYAEKLHYPIHIPNLEVQRHADRALRFVKSNELDRAKDEMIAITKNTPGPYLLACTELPIAYDKANLDPKNAVSSLLALAKATLIELGITSVL